MATAANYLLIASMTGYITDMDITIKRWLAGHALNGHSLIVNLKACENIEGHSFSGAQRTSKSEVRTLPLIASLFEGLRAERS